MTEEPKKQDEMQGPAGSPRADNKSGGRASALQHGDTRKVMAILGAVLLVAFVFAVVMGTGAGAKGTDSQAATAAAMAASGATPTPAPTGSSPREIAGALRRDATIACRAGQWDRCRTDLDQAAKLEPLGDKIAQVQHMRHMIETRSAD